MRSCAYMYLVVHRGWLNPEKLNTCFVSIILYLTLTLTIPGSILPGAPLVPSFPFAPLSSGYWIMSDSVVVGTLPFGGYWRSAIFQSAALPVPATRLCSETSLPGWCKQSPLQGQRPFLLKLTTRKYSGACFISLQQSCEQGFFQLRQSR